MLSTGSCHVWSIGADQTGPRWCCCCCCSAVLQLVVCSGLAGPWAGMLAPWLPVMSGEVDLLPSLSAPARLSLLDWICHGYRTPRQFAWLKTEAVTCACVLSRTTPGRLYEIAGHERSEVCMLDMSDGDHVGWPFGLQQDPKTTGGKENSWWHLQVCCILTGRLDLYQHLKRTCSSKHFDHLLFSELSSLLDDKSQQQQQQQHCRKHALAPVHFL